MNIAQLFISIGLKGASNTIGSLKGMKQPLKDVQSGFQGVSEGIRQTESSSFAMKAALLGAGYSLQQLFSKSNQFGTSLIQFDSLLGGSVETLQRYQYAAQQVGVSNDDVRQSFLGIQKVVTDTKIGAGIPEGFQQIALRTGLSWDEYINSAMNPEKLLQRLQQYTKLEADEGLRNRNLRSFGLSDSMISGLSQNAFNPEALSRAPVVSRGEAQALQKINAAWANLGTKIDRAVGNFNIKHGDQLISDITMLTTQILKLADAFTILAEKLMVLKVIGKAFEGWTQIFAGVTSLSEELSGPKSWDQLARESREGPKEILRGISDTIFGDSVIKKKTPAAVTPVSPERAKEVEEALLRALPLIYKEALQSGMDPSGISPAAPTLNTGAAVTPTAPSNTQTSNSTQNINVTQNMTFQNDPGDPSQVADSVQRAVRTAYFSLPSLSQGS